MSNPVASALLLIVAIAYLVGAFVVITALAKVLSAWSASWRTRGHAGPIDDVLQDHAATAMAAVAALANVTPPATHVVAYIGTPTGDDARTVGDGGLAVTRFRAGHPATVVFAQAALTGLSPAAVQSLAAHELAHVIRRERSSSSARYSWLVGYLALMLAGAGITVMALLAAPQLAAPALLATMSAAVAFLALRVAFDRREEIAADLFAVDLTRDLQAAAELMQFYEENLPQQVPVGALGRARSKIEGRLFATHPEPRSRIAAMRRHLGG